ncbi:MAG: glycosyltransferase [Nitrospira sp.]|nr:glycosyltransferase [Nitrospira sp.]
MLAYYRANGPIKTAAAIFRRVLGYRWGDENPVSGLENGRTQYVPALSIEYVVRYEEADMKRLGPIMQSATFMQELSLNMDYISSLEVLLTTDARSNTNTNQIALLSDGGHVLYEEELASLSVKGDSFYALRLGGDLNTQNSHRIYLVLRSSDGTENNGIMAWRSIKGESPLYALSRWPGTDELVSPERLLLQGTCLEGSLIVRITGKRMKGVQQYPRPPFPSGFSQQSSESLCVIAMIVDAQGDISEEGHAHLLESAMRKKGHRIYIVSPQEAIRRWSHLKPEVLVFHRTRLSEEVRQLLLLAKMAYVPTVYLCEEEIHPDVVLREEIEMRKESPRRTLMRERFALFKASDFSICVSENLCNWSRRNYKTPLRMYEMDSDRRHRSWNAIVRTDIVSEIRTAYRKRHLPMFSVVSVLYGKAKQLQPVLESYFRQSYEGEVEIVFVDDQTPDDSERVIAQCIQTAKQSGRYRKLPLIRVIRNEKNLGNCVSRNRGIREAQGDVIIVIDADCMVNKDFLRCHADAHSFDDCEVVIGPFNLETHWRDPLTVLEEYESKLERVLADSLPQDWMNDRSFLNCITRNFSIKTSFVREELFDPAFSYSKDPESGFGWEDVEMGYRLYMRGARIKYVSEAFSLHISHPPSVDERSKPLRSLRNYRRLFEKHPELVYVARRWALDMYENICAWGDKYELPKNDDRRVLDSMFQRSVPQPFSVKRNRPLRILTYRWHVPHQYELYKLPYQFTLITDAGTAMTQSWELRHRPVPNNVQFSSRDELDVRDFDLAILHFDENALAPERTNGVIGGDWGKSFKWFQQNVDLPKVAICHGTPQFYGQYDIKYDGADLMQVMEDERCRVVDFLGDVLVITNSYQAQREWGFMNSKVIWHGFDPSEFPPSTYEKGIISPFGPLVLSRPHYRGFFIYEKVFLKFPRDYPPATLYVPDPDVLYKGNNYAIGMFQNYVHELRRYSVYFNPTLRSPMPRARGEAMLCGLATVSAKNHDVEMFIKNGINGFYADDVDELREHLLFLMKNPVSAKKIGMEGRQTAADVFNHDRYLAEWEATLSKLIG